MKTRLLLIVFLGVGMAIPDLYAQDEEVEIDTLGYKIIIKGKNAPGNRVFISRGDDSLQDRVEIRRHRIGDDVVVIVDGDTVKTGNGFSFWHNDDDSDDLLYFRPGQNAFRFGPRPDFNHPGPHVWSFGDNDDNDINWNGFITGLDGSDFMFNLEDGTRELGEWIGNRFSGEVLKKENEARRLANRARRLEGTERAETEQEIETLLSEIFTLKQEQREERIKKLTEQLSKERQALSERENARQQMIERRKNRLLGEPDSLEW
jgi:hypothetical protein